MASASEFLKLKDEYRSGEIDESIVEMFEWRVAGEEEKKKRHKRIQGRYVYIGREWVRVWIVWELVFGEM